MVEMHFSSLCFTLIPILVPTFYFYHIYFLFGKMSFILVLSVNALMAKSWVIDGTIKIKKKKFILTLKNVTLASKLKKKKSNLLILTK